MFRNRQDAALQLAARLEKYRDKPVIVLGIPRGGIETGYYIAQHLNARLSVIIVRKLGFPRNPEFAFGAIAEDGTTCYLKAYKRNISQESIDKVEDEQLQEIRRRVLVFRKGNPLPDLRDQTVIIADDGIATGSTVIAAIRMCRKMGPANIIVAAPVAAADKEAEIQNEGAETVILKIMPVLYSVSEYFEDFHNFTDSEALHFLEEGGKKGQYQNR